MVRTSRELRRGEYRYRRRGKDGKIHRTIRKWKRVLRLKRGKYCRTRRHRRDRAELLRGRISQVYRILKVDEKLQKVVSEEMKEEVRESIRKKAGKIPHLEKAIRSTQEEAIKVIKEAGFEKDEVKKGEIIRDVALSTIKKLHDFWAEVELSIEREDILRKYSGWFVKPLASILEEARKANLDVHDMKYGKRLTVDKRDTIEDWIDGQVKEVEVKEIEKGEGNNENNK